MCKRQIEWEASVYKRVHGNGCPYITGQKTLSGFNDLATTNPRLANEWHPTKNGRLSPKDVRANSNKSVWWLYPYDDPRTKKHFDFEWQARIEDRSNGGECPYLSGQKIYVGFNDLATTHPRIAKEWHPKKNKNITPQKVTAHSTKKIHWMCPVCGTTYKMAVTERTKGCGCPMCSGTKGEKAVEEILKGNDIKYKKQNRFSDRLYKKELRDDFAILNSNNNVIGTIEYNGEQHYFPIDFAGLGDEHAEDEFRTLQLRDKIKSDYLKAHGIPQLIIPYTEFDDIEKLTVDFLRSIGAIDSVKAA